LDEASQINIPMTFLAISRSENILLVGDHMQLPPIFPREIEDDQLLTDHPIIQWVLLVFIIAGCKCSRTVRVLAVVVLAIIVLQFANKRQQPKQKTEG